MIKVLPRRTWLIIVAIVTGWNASAHSADTVATRLEKIFGQIVRCIPSARRTDGSLVERPVDITASLRDGERIRLHRARGRPYAVEVQLSGRGGAFAGVRLADHEYLLHLEEQDDSFGDQILALGDTTIYFGDMNERGTGLGVDLPFRESSRFRRVADHSYGIWENSRSTLVAPPHCAGIYGETGQINRFLMAQEIEAMAAVAEPVKLKGTVSKTIKGLHQPLRELRDLITGPALRRFFNDTRVGVLNWQTPFAIKVMDEIVRVTAPRNTAPSGTRRSMQPKAKRAAETR